MNGIATAAQDLTIRQPTLPLYSTAVEDPRTPQQRGAAYWQANLRSPVRFAQAITAAVKDGHRLFVEISPIQ